MSDKETYEDARVVVSNAFLVERFSPAMKDLGCEFYGNLYGNGTFEFRRVVSKEGEDLPVSWLRERLDELGWNQEPKAGKRSLKTTGPVGLCPACGERGRPTGRMDRGSRVYACDNQSCGTHTFVVPR